MQCALQGVQVQSADFCMLNPNLVTYTWAECTMFVESLSEKLKYSGGIILASSFASVSEGSRKKENKSS